MLKILDVSKVLFVVFQTNYSTITHMKKRKKWVSQNHWAKQKQLASSPLKRKEKEKKIHDKPGNHLNLANGRSMGVMIE